MNCVENMEKGWLDYIDKIYDKGNVELVITKRVKEGLVKVIERKILAGEIKADALEQGLTAFLLKEDTLAFIRERQPEVSCVPESVISEIKNYFKENIPNCQPTEVFRSSNHPNDAYLYSIVGKNANRSYSCWTAYNAATGSLNHGHYGIPEKEDAIDILSEYYHDITDEREKYNMNCSKVEIVPEQIGVEQEEMVVAQVVQFRQRRLGR
ncbi:hypothetical protein D7V86_15110 [bacterium D16-51]|nr:hypothetical protein D7V96_20525 [bacterium D16-59]RKI58754.1 hypothetical protein D7V86_15110 [bacterium D16-51]